MEKKILNKVTHLWEPYDKLSMKSGDTPEPEVPRPYPYLKAKPNQIIYKASKQLAPATITNADGSVATLKNTDTVAVGLFGDCFVANYDKPITALPANIFNSILNGIIYVVSYPSTITKLNGVVGGTYCLYINLSDLVNVTDAGEAIINFELANQPAYFVIDDAFDNFSDEELSNKFKISTNSPVTTPRFVFNTTKDRSDILYNLSQAATTSQPDKMVFVPAELISTYSKKFNNRIACVDINGLEWWMKNDKIIN